MIANIEPSKKRSKIIKSICENLKEQNGLDWKLDSIDGWDYWTLRYSDNEEGRIIRILNAISALFNDVITYCSKV